MRSTFVSLSINSTKSRSAGRNDSPSFLSINSTKSRKAGKKLSFAKSLLLRQGLSLVLILGLASLLLGMVGCGGESLSEKHKSAYEKGYKQGKAEADSEITEGCMSIYIFGGMPAESKSDKETSLPYKVLSRCVVKPFHEGRAHGHNDRIREYIKKHGLPSYSRKKDVEKKAVIERIRAVLPQGWRIIRVKEGQVAPVYHVPGQGVEIFMLRPHISPEEIKGVDITLHLMSLDYKGISTWQEGAQSNPSRFLGTTKSFKVYIHGGQGPTHGWENSESDLKQVLGISEE